MGCIAKYIAGTMPVRQAIFFVGNIPSSGLPVGGVPHLRESFEYSSQRDKVKARGWKLREYGAG
jgi:hypothetical protein